MLLLVITVVIMLGISELIARWLVAFEPGYYTVSFGKKETRTYPYGIIRINSLGLPDDEFDLTDRRVRIGYFGDSAIFGVGAGYGYRITELLENYYPTMQHMNISSGLGAGVTAKNIEEVLSWTRRLKLSTVVYVLNLNDISPGAADAPDKMSFETGLMKKLEAKFDILRGKSYLYTWVRNVIKDFLISHGYGAQGISYELFPKLYDHVIKATAQRISYLRRSLRQLGVELVVVVLPYEMQISEEAERIYREKGVEWGDGFIEGLTQRKLLEDLRGIRVFNAMDAFESTNGVELGRKFNRAGQYFVHDRGGRLDWNHPVRAGHRRIAEYLAGRAIFGRPEGLPTTPTAGGSSELAEGSVHHATRRRVCRAGGEATAT